MYDLPADVLDQQEDTPDNKSGQSPAGSSDTLQSVLQVDEGETVYDYAWYPAMLVSQPASCVFACSARVSILQNCLGSTLTFLLYSGDHVFIVYQLRFSVQPQCG